MAVAGSRVSIGNTATLVLAGIGDFGGGHSGFRGCTIKNLDATKTIDLGGSGVTSGTGFPLGPGDVMDLMDLGSADSLFGIVASGTASLALLQVL